MPITLSRLDLPREPAWLDLPLGVRVKVHPLDSALFAAASRIATIRLGAEPVPPWLAARERPDLAKEIGEARFADALNIALAGLAIVDWQGVCNEDGDDVAPEPEAIERLMAAQWAIAQDFHRQYVLKAEALEAEGNGSPSAPNGGTGAAATTADSASATLQSPADAATGDVSAAPNGSTRRKH